MIAPDPMPHQTDADSLIAALPGTNAIDITVVRFASRTHGSRRTSNTSFVSSDNPSLSAAFFFKKMQAPKKTHLN